MLGMTKTQYLKAKPPKGCCLSEYYESLLNKIGDMKSNFSDYMTCFPIDADYELCNIADADYDTCCALLTLLIREEKFSECGSFDRRYENGDVEKIIGRMIESLEEKEEEIRNLLRKRVAEVTTFNK